MISNRLIVVAAAITIALGAAAPAAAATVAPQLVLSTSNGAILITLAPGDAPDHVAALLEAVDGGAGQRWSVDRVAAGFYVQLGSSEATSISNLATEGAAIGNVRGAVSVYDGPESLPTIVILLADSHQLDDRYTPIGWVEAGLDVAVALSEAPAGDDGVPTANLSVGPLRRVDPNAVPVFGSTAPVADDRAPTATIVLMVVASAATGAIALLHRRLSPGAMTTLLLATTLIGFFAAWTGAIGHTAGRPYAAVVLFVLAVVVFRLMGRFEQPRGQSRERPLEPRA